jgi:hypothetical protein
MIQLATPLYTLANISRRIISTQANAVSYAESTVVQEFMTECFFLLRGTDLTSLQLCRLKILSNVHQLLRDHLSACQSD